MKLLFFLIFVSSTTYAGDSCSHPKVKLYFANGVGNTFSSASASWTALISNVNEYLKGHPNALGVLDQSDEPNLAFNVEEGILIKLQQLLDQKAVDEEGKLVRYLKRLDSAPDWFVDAFTQLYSSAIANEVSHSSTLATHVDTYTKEFDSQNPVLVVAHSQGNLFTNFAYEYLDEKYTYLSGIMNVIPVASPAGYVPGQNDPEDLYTTLFSDFLIRHIPGALEANTENSPHGAFDHEFVKHYLNGDQSGWKIMRQINSVLQNVASGDGGPSNVSEDLVPFYYYIQKLKSDRSQLSETQCLAIALFSKVQRLNCQYSTLGEIQNYIKQCDKEWGGPNKDRTAWCCSLAEAIDATWGVPDYNYEAIIKAANHPECKFNPQDMVNRLTPGKIEKAFEFLASKGVSSSSAK